jgi:hypothetical protein
VQKIQPKKGLDMTTLNCHQCQFRKKYDRNPKSLLGRLWKWHIGFCPGWKSYMKSLAPEERTRIAGKYGLKKWMIMIVLCLSAFSTDAMAWSEHPLMTRPVLTRIPELNTATAVQVTSLKRFLAENEKALENKLNDLEEWLHQNLDYYPSLPDALRFSATGNQDDILDRFYRAIRLNPNVKMQLYLHLLPGDSREGRPLIDPGQLTTLSNISSMKKTTYVKLTQGEQVSATAVVCTATDEPDYGLDLGLFEDNGTAYGKQYGFGPQPFGDPDLEYGSQAPFHMGFYHEAKIVFLAGPFLKKTLPEYRINQFKFLAEFAFESGNPYWGYRFMGWGMHYLGDLSMPYHSVALPGVGTFSMIWTNIKAMAGFPKSKDNAVQLVSNRHAVIEHFAWLTLRDAYQSKKDNHPLLAALKNPLETVPYHTRFPREVAAKKAAERADHVDRILETRMPDQLVSDPKFKTPGSPELDRLMATVLAEKGETALNDMTQALADLMQSYSMHLISYYHSILPKRV